MRDWRKLHKAILTSDRMPECSFEALWLWTLLTVAQDDAGRYPWTKAKVFALAGSYGMDFRRATALAEELVVKGIADWQGNYLHLVNGEVYNGPARKDRQGWFYEEPITAMLADSDSQCLSDDRQRQPTRAGVAGEEQEQEQEQETSLRDGASAPHSLREWQAVVREARNPAGALADMARALGEVAPDAKLAAALLGKAGRDRDYAAQLLWRASGDNPAGSLIRYAMGIVARNGRTNGNGASPKPAYRDPVNDEDKYAREKRELEERRARRSARADSAQATLPDA